MPIDLSKAGGEALNAIRDEIASVLEDGGKGLLEGAQEDVRLYAQGIANNMVAALKVSDEVKRAALVDELKAQAQMLLEINRLRADNAKWEAFERIIGTVGRVAVSFVTHIPVADIVDSIAKEIKP